MAALTVIVTNARIRTGDSSRPWVTAIGIREGKLAVAGPAAEILKMVGTDTRVIDAGGQLLKLPAGTTVGGGVVVTVSPDGSVTLFSSGDE